jgi:ligand-binding SRPBCC domain-containing protein
VIHAPRERVFDLARSVDAHRDSTVGTDERAVAGVTSGLLGLHDEVTWEARHLGARRRLAVRIVAFDRPVHFRDEMTSGAFASLVHDHRFDEHEAGTVMRDRLAFRAPLGVLGRIVERAFLASYLRRLLLRRNAVLKQLAESAAGSRYLDRA